MKRFFLSVVVLCSVSLTGMAQAQATYSNYHSGNRFDFEINAERLSKSPVWSEDQEWPPLTARAALKIAKAQLHRLFDDADRWTNRGLHMARLGDHWVYLVEFNEPPPPGALDHFSSPFKYLC
jgi:hypothetical protein